jgi:hypothetical protein
MTMSYATIGGQVIPVPEELAGKKITASVYDLKGVLVQKAVTRSNIIYLNSNNRNATGVLLVTIRVME